MDKVIEAFKSNYIFKTKILQNSFVKEETI